MHNVTLAFGLLASAPENLSALEAADFELFRDSRDAVPYTYDAFQRNSSPHVS